MEKTILITGASGFIGNHLIKKIPKYSTPIEKNGKKIDLREKEKVLKLKKVNTVIHLAGKTPYSKELSNNELFEHNILGTLNILEYCVSKKVEKLIFVSSYIYGNSKNNPINEKHIVHPHNTYTKSKYLAEELCKDYAKKFGIKVIILRPFNLFGNLQKKGFLISNIVEAIKNNSSISITNKNNKRDYLLIDDFIDVILKMIDFDCKLEIFNIGSGKSYSFEKIIQLFERKSGKTIKRKNKVSKDNNISKIQADISKITKKTGWYPKYNFEEGVEKILLEKDLLFK
jgi:GDP-4-dehydro-6-deoxy-D-mannose reductase